LDYGWLALEAHRDLDCGGGLKRFCLADFVRVSGGDGVRGLVVAIVVVRGGGGGVVGGVIILQLTSPRLFFRAMAVLENAYGAPTTATPAAVQDDDGGVCVSGLLASVRVRSLGRSLVPLLVHDEDEQPLNLVVVCVNPRAAFEGTCGRCWGSIRGVGVEGALAEDSSAEHDRRSSSSVRGLSWVIGRDIGFSSFGENFVF
jgi:hypothetical protein